MSGPSQVWTFPSDVRTATCAVQLHPLGVALFVTVAGVILRTEVARTPHAAKQVADQWRQAFEAKGWQA